VKPFSGTLSESYICQICGVLQLEMTFVSRCFFPQLRSKIASATSAIKSVFGQEVQQQDAVSVLPSSYGIAYCFFMGVSKL